MEEQCDDKATSGAVAGAVAGAGTWWQFRTRLERRLLIIASAMSLTLCAILTYAFFIRITSAQAAPVCMSADCVQTAAKFLAAIDPEADPCHDFARFACGHFFARGNPNATTSELAQSELAARGEYERVFEQPLRSTAAAAAEAISARNLRYLYRTCMNRSAIDAGVLHLKRALIAPLGGWPLISNNWDEAFTGHSGALNFNWLWLNFLRRLRTLGFHSEMFFSLRLHANFSDGRSYVRVAPPQLGEMALSKEFRKKNEAFLFRTLEAFGGDRARAAYDINYLGDFTLELIKIMSKYKKTPKGPSHDSGPEPQLITLGAVENLTQSSQIDWTQMLRTLTGRQQLSAADFIIFDDNMRDYMHDLQELLKKTPRRVLVNYIIWEVLKDMDVWYNVPNAPRQTIAERRHLCIEKVNKIMPLIANQELARNNPHREEVRKMLIDIREEIISRLCKVKWVGDAMRQFLEEKYRKIKFFIGGELDEHQLKVDYGEGDLSISENFIEAISKVKLLVDKYDANVIFNKTTVDIVFLQLLDMDAIANAFYFTNNIIAIPTGLIHQLYSKSLPDYINYATLGHLIGHELSHVLSLFAQKYGFHGEPNPLWSEDLIENYTTEHHCLAEEYEQYTLETHGIELNGSATLDENLADLIGTHSAYEVFRRLEPSTITDSLTLPAVKGYTSRQLFWIAFARYYCDPQEAHYVHHISNAKSTPDAHGIASFRIFSTLKKSQRFAVDFKCEKGSRMNPLRKCNF